MKRHAAKALYTYFTEGLPADASLFVAATNALDPSLTYKVNWSEYKSN